MRSVLLPAVMAAALLTSAAPAVAQGPGTSTSTGGSNAFNPAISVNALFLGGGFSGLDIPAAERGDLQRAGMRLQEMEMQFSSTIDPYSKADVIVTFENGAFDVEEGYVLTNVLPLRIGLRAGKMLVPIGSENPLHTHQLPFVQRSLVGTALFEEPLSEFGAEATYLVPLPFFVQLRGAAYNGDAKPLFAAPAGDLAYLGGASALWDLGESATISLEGDYLAGRNGAGRHTWTQVVAAVSSFKWRPTRQAIYRSLRATGEFLYGEIDADGPARAVTARGGHALLQYQFARRWWLQGRYDLESQAADAVNPWRASFLLGFVPSEFQALRLQISQVHTPGDTYAEAFVQYNFTIGSHPAHKY